MEVFQNGKVAFGSALTYTSTEQWVQIQTNTFKNWLNEKLHPRSLEIRDLRTGFRDGVALVALVEMLTGRRIPAAFPRPANQYESIENVTLALNAISKDGVRIVNIGSHDVVEGSMKLVLALIWQLILRYQVGLSAVQHRHWILKWLKGVIPECPVVNFTTDWNDGLALHALLEFCRPGIFNDWRRLDRSNKLNNCRNAMKLARQHFGIPLILRPEDLASPGLDERSAITYLSYFIRVGGPGYTATLDRIQQRVPSKALSNFTTDWHDGRALCELIRNSGGALTEVHGAPIDVLHRAMETGRRMGVDPILTPEEVLEETQEHLGNMAYTAQFLPFSPIIPYQYQNSYLPPKASVSMDSITYSNGLHTPQRTSSESSHASGTGERKKYKTILVIDSSSKPGDKFYGSSSAKPHSQGASRQMESGRSSPEKRSGKSSGHKSPAKHGPSSSAEKPRHGGGLLNELLNTRSLQRRLKSGRSGGGEVKRSQSSRSPEKPPTWADRAERKIALANGDSATSSEEYVYSTVNKPSRSQGGSREKAPTSQPRAPKQPRPPQQVQRSTSFVHQRAQALEQRSNQGQASGSAAPGTRTYVTQVQVGTGHVTGHPNDVTQQRQQQQQQQQQQEAGQGGDIVYPRTAGKGTSSASEASRPRGESQAEGQGGESVYWQETKTANRQGEEGNRSATASGSSEVPTFTTVFQGQPSAGSSANSFGPSRSGTQDGSQRDSSFQAVSQSKYDGMKRQERPQHSPLENSTLLKRLNGDRLPAREGEDVFSEYEARWVVQDSASSLGNPHQVRAASPPRLTDSLDRARARAQHNVLLQNESDGGARMSDLDSLQSADMQMRLYDSAGPGADSSPLRMRWNDVVDEFSGGRELLPSRDLGTGDGVRGVRSSHREQHSEFHSRSMFQEVSESRNSHFSSSLARPADALLGSRTYSDASTRSNDSSRVRSFRERLHGDPSRRDQLSLDRRPQERDQANPNYFKVSDSVSDTYPTMPSQSRSSSALMSRSLVSEGDSDLTPLMTSTLKREHKETASSSTSASLTTSLGTSASKTVGNPFERSEAFKSRLDHSVPYLRMRGEHSEEASAHESYVSVRTIPSVKASRGVPHHTPSEHYTYGRRHVTFDDRQVLLYDEETNSQHTSTMTSASQSPPFHMVGRLNEEVRRLPSNVELPPSDTYKLDTYSVGVIIDSKMTHPFDPEKLRVEAEAPSGRVIKINGNGQYTAQFTSAEIGTWKVALFYDTRFIDGCPVDVCDPSQVRVLDLKGGHVNKQQSFRVDCSKAGNGDLGVDITHSGRHVPTHVHRATNGVHKVTYTPHDPGPYEINVHFNRAEVRDSEFHSSDPEERQRKALFYTIITEENGWIKIKTSCDWEIDYMTGGAFVCHMTDSSDIQVYGMQDGTICSAPELIVDCTKADDDGILQAEVTHNGKRFSAIVTRDQHRVYRVSFKPRGPGIYKIWITYDGVPVKGSPFIQEIDELRAPTALGEGLKRAVVGRPAQFTVDPHGFPGPLTVNVQGPSQPVPTSVQPDPEGVFHVQYVAREVGHHQIIVRVENKAAEGSPFHLRVVDPSRVRVSGGWRPLVDDKGIIPLVVGKEKHIPFDASEAGEGDLTAEVHDHKGRIPVAIDTRGDGRNTVIFTPREEGKHYIDVFWCGFPLDNSPYVGMAIREPEDSNIRLVPIPLHRPPTPSPSSTSTSPSGRDGSPSRRSEPVVKPRSPLKVILSGRGLVEAQVDKEAEFKIDGTEAGDGIPSVQMASTRSQIPVSVEAVRPRVFRCTYVPRLPGAYLLYTKWNEQPLKGSPFKVNVRPSVQARKVKTMGPGLQGGVLGKDLDIHIDPREAGSGELTAKCTDPTGLDLPCHLQTNYDGTVRLRVTPRNVGRHILEIRYNGDHVLGSPYFIDIKGSTSHGDVTVYGPGIENGVLSDFKSHFTVDATGAGAGELRVRIMGPRGAFKVKMRKANAKDKRYECFYDPIEPGVYTISVDWSGQPVGGSPFSILLVTSRQELERLEDERSSRYSYRSPNTSGTPRDILY